MLSKRASYALALLLCAYALHHVNAQSSTDSSSVPSSSSSSGSTPSASSSSQASTPSGGSTTNGGSTPSPGSTTLGPSTTAGSTAAPPAGCNTTNCPAECACVPANIWLDIILVVDTSSSMTYQGLIETQAFLAGIIGDLTVSQMTGRNARLAIVGFSSTATIFRKLTDLNSTQAAVDAIHNITYSGNDDVNIEAAFMTAGDVIRTSDFRPNARNVILFVTSANQKGPFNDPHPIASQLKNQGNVIVTVAYAQASTSTPPNIDYASPGYNFTNTQANFTYYIGLAMCDINCFCPPLWTQFSVGVIGTPSYKKYGECLYPGDFPTSWDEAHRACSFQNGYVLDVLSPDKQTFATNLANQKFPAGAATGYWIGLNNKTGSGWSWDRGSATGLPLDSNDYANWAAGFPTGSPACVGHMRISGFILKWKNLECSHAFTDSYNYFCQLKSCDTNNYCLPGNSP